MSIHYLWCTGGVHRQWDPHVSRTQGCSVRGIAMSMPQPSWGEKPVARQHTHVLRGVCA